MKWLSRLAVILKTVYRFGLADLLAARGKTPWFVKLLPRSGKMRDTPLPVRLRLALESLGPIFVKLGQVLSTRPDLLPAAYALELSRLQDKVPPFDADLARRQIEASFGRPSRIWR